MLFTLDKLMGYYITHCGIPGVDDEITNRIMYRFEEITDKVWLEYNVETDTLKIVEVNHDPSVIKQDRSPYWQEALDNQST
jgi:hypothetical protein